jgi:hypothetical protein
MVVPTGGVAVKRMSMSERYGNGIVKFCGPPEYTYRTSTVRT